jgi:hypothetical protein
MRGKSLNGKKVRWEDSELSFAYHHFITLGEPIEDYLASNQHNRSVSAVTTKLWKHFGIATRKISGKTYCYLSDAPKKIVDRRDKAINDIKTTTGSKGMLLSDIEPVIAPIDRLKSIKRKRSILELELAKIKALEVYYETL